MKFLFFFFINLITVNSFAQKFILKQYSTSEGLSSSQVYSVFQDSKGYMWFATDAGACKYNGVEFKTYTTKDGLTDNTVFSFCEDTKHRIWTRTISGKVCYFENDKIISLPCNSEVNKFMSNGVFASIYVDSKDVLYLGFTLKDEYLKIAPPYKNIEYVKLFNKEGGRYIKQVGNGEFIFGVSCVKSTSYSLLFNSNKNSSYYFPINANIAKSPSPIAINIGNNQFLISIDNQLYELSAKGVEFVLQREQSIISLMMDSEKNIWIGCMNDGLYKVSYDKTKEIKHYMHSLSITKVLEDKEHGYWISTLSEGVFYSPNINIQYYDAEDGFCKEPFSVCEYNKNTIAIGGRSGELNLFSNGNKISTFSISDTLIKNELSHLALVGKDSLMVGGQKRAFLLCNENKVVPFKNEDGSQPYCKNISYNGSGIVYCIQYGCVAAIDVKTKQTIQLLQLQQRAHAIYANRNKIWLGTINGLMFYNGNTLEDWSSKNPLLKSRIVDIKAVDEKTLLLVTKDAGLLLLKGDNVYQLTHKNFPTALFNSAFVANASEVWLTSNLGLHQIQINDTNITSVSNYNVEKGLLTNEVFQITKHNDVFYVTSKKGIMLMQPGFDKKENYAPPLYISSLIINEKKVILKKEYSLAYNENYITLNYHAICYKGRNNLMYRYKLNSDDSVWQYTTASSLSFPRMPSGDYQLHIEARGPDGVWNKNETIDLHIFIDKPFWLKWWFFTLSGIFLIALTYIILQNRYNQKLKQQEREISMNKKLANMQLSMLKAQMNPHFIFNSINSIQSFIIKNENKLARKYLSTFSKLLRSILEHSASEEITLQEEIDTLKHYLEIEALRFDDFKFDINVAQTIDVLSIKLPAMLIQPYIENAIWHGLMHKEGIRELHVDFEMKDENLLCKIDDNGIGRKKSAEINSHKSEKRKSFGMSITSERLEILNYHNHNGPHIVVIDKFNEFNEPTGTRVEIIIPITKANDTKHNN